jgi:hypothetical protein
MCRASRPEVNVTGTSLDRGQVVFRKTNARKGRHIAVTPANSATRHLSYGRIRLDAEVPEVSFEAGGEEVGLVCFHGSATVTWTGRPSPSAATTPCTFRGTPESW